MILSYTEIRSLIQSIVQIIENIKVVLKFSLLDAFKKLIFKVSNSAVPIFNLVDSSIGHI